MKKLNWAFILSSLLVFIFARSGLGDEPNPAIKHYSFPEAIDSAKFSLLGRNLEKVFRSSKRDFVELLHIDEKLIKNDVLRLRLTDNLSSGKDVFEHLELEISFANDQISSLSQFQEHPSGLLSSLPTRFAVATGFAEVTNIAFNDSYL